MKKQRLSNFPRAIAALRASLAVALIICLTYSPGTTETSFIGGVRINNGKSFGIVGTYKSLSNRMGIFLGGDLGADEGAVSSTYMLHFKLSTRLSLSAILGPQVEIIETDPSTDQTAAYLMGSTGAALSYAVTDKLSFWSGLNYLLTDTNLRKWKFGAGFSATL